MPTDIFGILILVVSSVITFTVARRLSRGWRDKRRQEDEAKRRAGESRQARRARERREQRAK